MKKLPWFTCCALGLKVNPKTIWQNLLKALWIIHGLLVTDCTAADFTGNTLLITTGFFKHERVHSCKKQKTHHAHTHQLPEPSCVFLKTLQHPPPAALLAGCRNGLSLWLFQSVKEKNLMIVDICWSSPCELSWSLACGNHHLTLCTHKRSWRVGCHGNSGSFGYGCVSWRQHMLNFLLCPISALQIFPWITFFI